MIKQLDIIKNYQYLKTRSQRASLRYLLDIIKNYQYLKTVLVYSLLYSQLDIIKNYQYLKTHQDIRVYKLGWTLSKIISILKLSWCYSWCISCWTLSKIISILKHVQNVLHLDIQLDIIKNYQYLKTKHYESLIILMLDIIKNYQYLKTVKLEQLLQ